MTKKSIILTILVILLIFFFVSCKEKIVIPDTPAAGTLLSYNGCKTFQRDTDKENPQNDPRKECLEYEYDGTDVLYLNHINAGFNCCPGKIVAEIDIKNNIITIIEKETDPSCRCLCLFDVKYKFLNLEQGEYRIRIEGPCHSEAEKALEFTLKLFSPLSGIHCVNRTNYPWG